MGERRASSVVGESVACGEGLEAFVRVLVLGSVRMAQSSQPQRVAHRGGGGHYPAREGQDAVAEDGAGLPPQVLVQFDEISAHLRGVGACGQNAG